MQQPASPANTSLMSNIREKTMTNGGIPIDASKAKAMIGKVVLVGVTYRNEKDEVTGLQEYFGVVTRINETEGLVIISGDNDEEIGLPPMLEQYEVAGPGIYNLKSCDYSVENPDFLATWTVYPPSYSGPAL